MQALGLASSCFCSLNGTLLKLKARELSAYNDIYSEYGNLMLLVWGRFPGLSLILIFVELKRKRSLN